MWVEETKNGKYKYSERYIDPLTGKRKKVSITLEKNTAKNRKDAVYILQTKIEKEMSTQNTKQITFEKLTDLYKESQLKNVKKSTYARNCSSCKALLNIFGKDILVNKLNAGYIKRVLLQTGYKNGTLNEHLRRLKEILRWGYKNDLLSDISYLDKLEKFKDTSNHEKNKDKFLESNEVKLLLDNMQVKHWRDLTEFLVLSGVRFGEAAALLRSDIDLKENVIHITKTYDNINKIATTPKTLCSIRDVYMQDELRELCKRLLRETFLESKVLFLEHDQDLLFKNINGTYINNCCYNNYLRNVSKKVLGRSVSGHIFRHTHASLLMEQGLTIDEISRRLGHEDSQITKEIYLHITSKLKEQDNERIRKIKIL